MNSGIDGYSKIIDNNFKEFMIAEELDKELMDNFLKECKEEILSNILTNFGLSRIFDNFKDGGNIATVNNAELGIFPDRIIKERYEKPYQDVEKLYRNQLPKKRKELFQNNKSIKSYGTGRKLKKDGSTHLDHIVSAKAIHSNKKARIYMNHNQIGNMAQDNSNLAALESNINQSKGEKNLDVWLNKKRKNGQRNADYFEVDEKNMLYKEKKSMEKIDLKVKSFQLEAIYKSGIEQGLNMGQKQVVGMVLFEFTNILFYFSRSLFKEWEDKENLDDKIKVFNQVFLDSIEFTKLKLEFIPNKLLKEFIIGSSAGFSSNFITFIINEHTTTMKGLAKIINDSFHSFLKAFVLVVKRPKGISLSDASKEAMKIVSAALIVSGGVVFSETIKIYLMQTPLSPMADSIATAIASILTGILTASILYSINNFRHILDKVCEDLCQLLNYKDISKKAIEDRYKKINLEIDELYQEILNSIYKEYEDLGDIRSMAYDFNLLSSERFNNSIKYAERVKVKDEEIIKNKIDIDNFFNN